MSIEPKNAEIDQPRRLSRRTILGGAVAGGVVGVGVAVGLGMWNAQKGAKPIQRGVEISSFTK